jgi:hypothetical protein
MSKEYFYYSWSLSVLTIKEHYGQVELVTDTMGKEMLYDLIGLPYSNVTTHLDTLQDVNPRLWAKAKLEAYSLQNEPFIHIDGDIFLFEKFTDHVEKAAVVTQNKEDDFDDYKKIWKQVLAYFPMIPNYLRKDYEESQRIRSFNSGVFGGTDLDFIKEYVAEANSFLNKNTSAYDQLDIEHAVLIYEQYLLGALARSKGINIECLFQEMDEQYSTILDFKNTYHTTGYFHALGLAKSKFIYCNYIRHMLLTLFPEYYYRIHALIKDDVI